MPPRPWLTVYIGAPFASVPVIVHDRVLPHGSVWSGRLKPTCCWAFQIFCWFDASVTLLTSVGGGAFSSFPIAFLVLQKPAVVSQHAVEEGRPTRPPVVLGRAFELEAPLGRIALDRFVVLGGAHLEAPVILERMSKEGAHQARADGPLRAYWVLDPV